MDIRFVSKNTSKFNEVETLFQNMNEIKIIHIEENISELQTENIEKLIRDKVLKAFKLIGRPLFVDHTCFYIESLGNFPGGLTQLVWDSLQADNFSRLFGNLTNTSVTAQTTIAYCDAKKIYTFEGKIKGKIASQPRGNSEFQWDTIFIPDNNNLKNQTFAEMGNQRKNEFSMRKIALEKFHFFLQRNIVYEKD